jgi:formylglycine-generating enzyme required for sulfatase activity
MVDITDSSTCISSGCEVVINNNSSYTTGCSSSGCGWSTNGVSASTTGNQYGIYDMNGGAWEYVMGNMVDSSGNYYPSSSGLSKPDTKYYDSYAYSASTYTDHARGHLGDATKETLKTFGSITGSWYSGTAGLPSGANSWVERGGSHIDGSAAGVFHFHRDMGESSVNGGFRSVITAP